MQAVSIPVLLLSLEITLMSYLKLNIKYVSEREIRKKYYSQIKGHTEYFQIILLLTHLKTQVCEFINQRN